MKKQRGQVIALVLLLVIWAVLWHFFIKARPAPAVVAKQAAAKTAQAESLLKSRFHRVRAEMDALYHYRIKPIPFDAHWNPFRIPGVPDAATADSSAPRVTAMDVSQLGIPPPDFAQSVLKSAIASVRIGGVVTMHGTIELTVDTQLHKEGDVFTVRIQTSKTEFKPVRIRIKSLTEAAVVFALADSDAGSAELRIGLK
jgi:hypothetical protein